MLLYITNAEFHLAGDGKVGTLYVGTVIYSCNVAAVVNLDAKKLLSKI